MHMPPAQRKAWGALVNYFVFDETGDPVAHLPSHARSIFGADVTPGEVEEVKGMLRRSVRL